MWKLFWRKNHAHRKSIPFVGIFTVVGIVGALALSMIVTLSPGRRLSDLRNAKRFEDVNVLGNVFTLQQERDGVPFNGDPSAPVDSDPHTAQVIAEGTSGVTCAPGLPTTPSCPGAAMNGLVVPATGSDCVAVHGQGVFANYSGTNADVAPIDPFGAGSDPEAFIVDSALGARNSGYYVNRIASGRLEIGACHPENGASIRALR